MAGQHASVIIKSLTALLAAWLLLWLPAVANAESKEVIDVKVKDALQTFARESPAGVSLMNKAAGVLVFPGVAKLGFGIGGEYGEGSLLIDGEPTAYYSTTSASFGLQLGIQFKTQVILFMTDAALRRFQQSEGWEAGVDGSIAIARSGAGGKIDSKTLREPVVAFIFSNRGLMYNLTLEGSKITRLK